VQTVQNLQPHFVDEGKILDVVNPYGKTVLDAVKAGSVIYVGQSAGTVALSHNIGPLTTDPTDFRLDTDEEGEVIDLDEELGKKMVEPGLGAYLGIPHRLIFRPHLSFNPATFNYMGRALATEKLGKVLTDGVGEDDATHDVYCAITADYNFKQGQGDVIEVSEGQVVYHVGFCSDEVDLAGDARAKLAAAGLEAWASRHASLRRQPPGNPQAGWSFTWSPRDGEVHAAGPNAKGGKRWRIYASSAGPIAGVPPY